MGRVPSCSISVFINWCRRRGRHLLSLSLVNVQWLGHFCRGWARLIWLFTPKSRGREFVQKCSNPTYDSYFRILQVTEQLKEENSSHWPEHPTPLWLWEFEGWITFGDFLKLSAKLRGLLVSFSYLKKNNQKTRVLRPGKYFVIQWSSQIADFELNTWEKFF